jgi:hypothetical protein
MRLSDVTAESVHRAIAVCDRLGREAFRHEYGYQAALEYELEYEGRRYDSKAIVGVAYLFATGEPPRRNFTGGEQTVVRRLHQLGFTVGPSLIEGRRMGKFGVKHRRPSMTGMRAERGDLRTVTVLFSAPSKHA